VALSNNLWNEEKSKHIGLTQQTSFGPAFFAQGAAAEASKRHNKA
jgi:hypothetical protein